MSKLKDLDLGNLPEPVRELLKAIVPEDADVEIHGFALDDNKNADDTPTDNCSAMHCDSCDDCILDRIAAHGEICKGLNDLYARKNTDYGNSFGDTYKELGIVSAITRITDKTNRLKSLCKPGTTRKVTDENIRDTLLDLANYAIMTVVEMDAQEGGM